MKHLLIAVLNIFLLSSVCSAVEKLDLTDEKVKVNYSVGYQVGGDFKRQGLAIAPEILLQGIRDAVSEAEPRMNPDEMRNTLVDLQKRVATAQQEKRKMTADKNLAAGKAFLSENVKKTGVVTLPSGLQYKVVTEGSGAKPKATDSVTVNYRGTLIDGTEFDSSYSRNQPAMFKVNGVIPGWTAALQLMKKGAKWQLFIPSELAYGEKGAGSRIGPNSTLIFEVELIAVQTTP